MSKNKRTRENRPLPGQPKHVKKRPFSTVLTGESRTQQHFKDECNINNIISRYENTGIDPFSDRKANESFGYATSKDFFDAQIQVAKVNSAFAELSATRRETYHNDPREWIDDIAAQNEARIQESATAALKASKDAETPPETTPVSPPKTAPTDAE